MVAGRQAGTGIRAGGMDTKKGAMQPVPPHSNNVSINALSRV